MRQLRLLTLAALLPLVACAGRSGAGSETAPRYERNRINLPEIEEAIGQNITNAYDLVRARRPAWLRQQVQGVFGQMSQIAVWVDNIRAGGLEALRQVPTPSVISIRYLSPSEAQAELGLDNVGGAILVLTRT